MKTHLLKTFTLTIIMTALMIGMTLPANAAYDPFKAMEDRSRQAVAAAIKEGTIPPDATIYDCAYSKGEDGVTRVVRYKDKNGNWIDVSTGKKVETAEPSVNAANAQKALTPDELKAYADKVFELVNKEREKAGFEPLERDSLLDEAAMIRAAEIKIVDNAGGEPHTRPDGTSFKALLDDMGITGKRCGENITRAKTTPQNAMTAWMDSDGHRKNILREDYGSIGIGVYQRSDGKLDWTQIFERK